MAGEEATAGRRAVGTRLSRFCGRVPKGTHACAAYIPAISPYLRHGCMAGYQYQMPMASTAQKGGKLQLLTTNFTNWAAPESCAVNGKSRIISENSCQFVKIRG